MKGNYEIFSSLYLPKYNGETTKIDAILIHENAVFILEIKNLYGKITGNIDDKHWNQRLNDGLEHKFYNPILQNKGHIKCFKQNIDLYKYSIKDKDIYSIIVFGNNSNIESVKIEEENLKVTNLSKVDEVLNLIVNDTRKILSNKDIEDISSILQEYTDVDSEIKEKHIKDIERDNSKVLESDYIE